MFKVGYKAHQFYHVSLFKKSFRICFLAELALNLCIGFYMFYMQIELFSSLFMILIPVLVYLGLMMYALNGIQALSTPEKTACQFYRMIPNSFDTFKSAMYSTLFMVILLSSIACSLNIIMTQDHSFIYPYICIYAMWILGCVYNVYLSLTRSKHMFVLASALSTVMFAFFMLCLSMKDNFINPYYLTFVLLFVVVCITLSYLLVKKAIRFMKEVWWK